MVFIGWGAVARRVAALLAERGITGIAIVGVAVRDASKPQPDLPSQARLFSDPGELGGLAPDVVVEAAGRSAVGIWGEPALACGCDFVVTSTSAFGDDALLDRLTAAARRHGGRIIIPPGAMAGIDALAAASAMLDSVQHTIIKPAKAWRGTAAETLANLDDLSEPLAFFRGNAREAARLFPQNANVAMTSALAGIGPERTSIVLVADPAATRNTHRLEASGGFGRLSVVIENEPMAANPKTSEMTALSLARLLGNRCGALAC